jgi:RNA polymerase sigma-70 factor (ECF subfamily)
VQKAISALPEEQRAAIVLHDLQGYSYEEIAVITEVPIGTVKSRLSRARLKLAGSLAAIKEQNGRLNV